jgi:hypothetical protein
VIVNTDLGSRVRYWLPLIGSSLLLSLAMIAFTPLSESQSEGPLHPTPDRKSMEGASADTRVKPLRVNVNLVLVPVEVTDAMNHPVAGLEKQNFVLFDNDE